MKIPEVGKSAADVAACMRTYREGDATTAAPKLFSLVYFGRPDVLAVAKDAYMAFFSENALNPMAFPSLRRMESEVVAMTLDLLHGPPGSAGSMTSGGSESLLLAVKTARAQEPGKAESPSRAARLKP